MELQHLNAHPLSHMILEFLDQRVYAADALTHCARELQAPGPRLVYLAHPTSDPTVSADRWSLDNGYCSVFCAETA